MAWYAYGRTRTVGGATILSSYSSAGAGVWLSDRDITGSSMPSLNASRGILIDLSGCMSFSTTASGSYVNPTSLSINWPIMTGLNTDVQWVHSSSYPYIGIAEARIFLSKIKGNASGATITSILNNSVYLTESYNGVINDTINSSTSAASSYDGYTHLYASGSYGNFPDYRNDGTENVSYCYGPTLVSAITSYSDINAYLSQGYYYAGVYFNMLRQQFTYRYGGATSNSFRGYVDIVAPQNTYCTAEYSSSFESGSKVYTSGAWRGIKSAKVYVGGEWKDVKGMKVCVNGVWKEVPQTQVLEWAEK